MRVHYLPHLVLLRRQAARLASRFRRCVNRNGRVKGELLLTGGVVVELRRHVGLDLADEVLEGVPTLVPHVELLLPQRPLRRCELLLGSTLPTSRPRVRIE